MSADQHLSPRQLWLRQDQYVGRGDALTGTAYKMYKMDKPDDLGYSHHMVGELEHTPTLSSYSYPDGSSSQDTFPHVDSSGRDRLEGHSRIDRLWAEREGKPKLFGEAHIPAHTDVTMLASTEASRIHIPTMLGMMQNFSQEQFGQGLSPSTDLSPFSQRLVEGLHARGLVDSPPDYDSPGNNMSWLEESRHTGAFWGFRPEDRERWEVRPDELAAGRKTARAALSRKRGAQPNAEPEQQSLF